MSEPRTKVSGRPKGSAIGDPTGWMEYAESLEVENERLREAADKLLGCIVEAPDGELELVIDSNAEIEALRAACRP